MKGRAPGLVLKQRKKELGNGILVLYTSLSLSNHTNTNDMLKKIIVVENNGKILTTLES